ncbi:hypothetical protein J3E68DRAFT_81867 [Trichoderma sp. SZMC 28012]
MTERLQEWYGRARPDPRDLAYTLAGRREHLHYPSCSVASYGSRVAAPQRSLLSQHLPCSRQASSRTAIATSTDG